MGLGILSPRGHPDDDPNLRVPGTHVLWTSEHEQRHDSEHIVLYPTVLFPPPQKKKGGIIKLISNNNSLHQTPLIL